MKCFLDPSFWPIFECLRNRGCHLKELSALYQHPKGNKLSESEDVQLYTISELKYLTIFYPSSSVYPPKVTQSTASDIIAEPRPQDVTYLEMSSNKGKAFPLLPGASQTSVMIP